MNIGSKMLRVIDTAGQRVYDVWSKANHERTCEPPYMWHNISYANKFAQVAITTYLEEVSKSRDEVEKLVTDLKEALKDYNKHELKFMEAPKLFTRCIELLTSTENSDYQCVPRVTKCEKL